MRNVIDAEPQVVQDAISHLIATYVEARRTGRSGIKTLVLLAVAEAGAFGTVLLAGCDSDENRADAVDLAETITDLPRDTIN